MIVSNIPILGRVDQITSYGYKDGFRDDREVILDSVNMSFRDDTIFYQIFKGKYVFFLKISIFEIDKRKIIFKELNNFKDLA